MPSQRLLLRPSCKSGNAYNVSVALTATFCAASVQLNTLNGTDPAGSLCLRPRTFPLQQQQRLRFSTSVVRERDERATPDRKLGAGNLFADYEALTRTFGDPRASRKSSASATDGDSGVRKTVASANAADGISVVRTSTASSRSQRKKALRARSDIPQKEKSGVNSSAADDDTAASDEVQTLARRVHIATWTLSERRALAAANIPLEEYSESGSGPRRFIRDRDSKRRSNNEVWQRHMFICADRAWRLSQKPVTPSAIKQYRASLDYQPWAIDPAAPPAGSTAPIPWAVEASVRPPTGTELLDQEILKFAQHIELSPAEAAARKSVIATVVQTIESCGGPHEKLNIEIHGSEETGLATPTSDIDFRIAWQESPGDSEPNPTSLGPTLRFLFHRLREDATFSKTEFRAAKFPIITTVHKDTGIDIQIVAAPSTKPQQTVTAQYLAEIPHLRAVYQVLRTAFGVRGLVDVHSGGIGAYGLFMMLVAALKRKSSKPPVTPGEQLIRFLDLYSVLNMEKYGLSISPPKLFRKHNATDLPIKVQIDAARRRGDPIRAGQWAIGQTRLYQPYLFCLQDPANAVNDLGRKTNAIKHIQRTIMVLNNTLRRDRQEIFVKGLNKKPWEVESMLEPLVGRCHEIYRARRMKVEEYGLKIMMQKMTEEKEGKQREPMVVAESEKESSAVDMSEPVASEAQRAALG